MNVCICFRVSLVAGLIGLSTGGCSCRPESTAEQPRSPVVEQKADETSAQEANMTQADAQQSTTASSDGDANPMGQNDKSNAAPLNKVANKRSSQPDEHGNGKRGGEAASDSASATRDPGAPLVTADPAPQSSSQGQRSTGAAPGDARQAYHEASKLWTAAQRASAKQEAAKAFDYSLQAWQLLRRHEQDETCRNLADEILRAMEPFGEHANRAATDGGAVRKPYRIE